MFIKSPVTLLTICFLVFFTSSVQSQDNEILLTRNATSEGNSNSIIFFSNGGYSVSEKSANETTKNFKGKLSESELKELKKEIRSVRPIALKDTYYCNKEMDRLNSTMYFFSTHRLRKKVIINNSCKTPKNLQKFDEYLESLVTDPK